MCKLASGRLPPLLRTRVTAVIVRLRRVTAGRSGRFGLYERDQASGELVRVDEHAAATDDTATTWFLCAEVLLTARHGAAAAKVPVRADTRVRHAAAQCIAKLRLT